MLPGNWKSKLTCVIKVDCSSNTSGNNASSACDGFLSVVSFYCWFWTTLFPNHVRKRRERVTKPENNHNIIILRSWSQVLLTEKNKCLKLKMLSSLSRKKKSIYCSLQDIRSEQIIALWFLSTFCHYKSSKYSINCFFHPRIFLIPTTMK